MLWNYVFEWAWGFYDWTIFHVIRIGWTCIEGKLLPHKLIGYVGYPVRPWMYCLYKGGNTALSKKWDKL